MTSLKQSTPTKLLREAIKKGDIDYVRSADKSEIRITGLDGIHLLKLAFKSGAEMSSALCSGKIDLDQFDELDGRTPLIMAIEVEDLNVFKMLIENGANPHLAGIIDHRVTPLYSAANYGCTEFVDYLIKCKCNVDGLNDPEDKTALMIACQNGFPAVAKLLLESEANHTLLSKCGENARFMAFNNGHRDVTAVLDRHQSKMAAQKQHAALLNAAADVLDPAKEPNQPTSGQRMRI